MSKISVLESKNYDEKELEATIRNHFKNLGGAGKYIKEGTKVLIKPNLLMKRSPDAMTTTHPTFMTALINVVKSFGGVVTIADSPGGPYTVNYLKSVYSETGMEEVAKNTDSILNYDLADKEKSYIEGVACKRFRLMKPYFDADVIITASKIKTHALTKFTGAVKNNYGLIPGLMKAELHLRYPEPADFCEMVVDLCEAVKPTLSFMDGVIGMEGNGPSGGTPRFIGVTAASENPYELDFLCSHIIGYKLEDIALLQSAVKRGLCPDDVEKLDVIGDDYKKFIIADFKKPDTHNKMSMFNNIPNFIKKPMQRAFTQIPVINSPKCIGCAECFKACPAKTIKMKSKKAVINYADCIKCFCCQELCPERAIDIKRKGLFRK